MEDNILRRRFISLAVTAMMLAGIMITPTFALDNVTDESAAEAAVEETEAANASNNEDAKEIEKDKAKTLSEQAITHPKVVRKVKARAKGRGKSVITWKRSKDAHGYIVYMAHSKNGKYKKIKSIKGNKKTKSVHKYSKLKKNKHYYYKVYAYKKTKKKVLVSKTARRDPAKNTLSVKRSFRVKATAYSGGGRCANGKRCKVGRIAVDPRVIPLGTWLYVKGYGICQACDTGGAIKGKKIDLYFNSEGKCYRYGVRSTKVYILR